MYSGRLYNLQMLPRVGELRCIASNGRMPSDVMVGGQFKALSRYFLWNEENHEYHGS
jgi:hypothetical protein